MIKANVAMAKLVLSPGLGNYQAGILRIPGAGPGFTAPRFQPGVITLQMNIHCIDPSDKTFFRSEYAKIDKPRPYQARNAAVPEKYYLARVVPGLCRAVDYLAARPDWNGRSLVAAGSSQGGALSLMCAAFSGKVTAVSASIPAFGDQNGRFSARAPGWPNLYSVMARFEKQLPDAERKRICGYFDLVNFVPKIKVSETVEKITNPGRKAVYRVYDSTGHATADLITHDYEEVDLSEPYRCIDTVRPWKDVVLTDCTAKPLLRKVVSMGERVAPFVPLEEIRSHVRRQLSDEIWEEEQRFENPHVHRMDMSPSYYSDKMELLRKSQGSGQ